MNKSDLDQNRNIFFENEEENRRAPDPYDPDQVLLPQTQGFLIVLETMSLKIRFI